MAGYEPKSPIRNGRGTTLTVGNSNGCLENPVCPPSSLYLGHQCNKAIALSFRVRHGEIKERSASDCCPRTRLSKLVLNSPWQCGQEETMHY